MIYEQLNKILRLTQPKLKKYVARKLTAVYDSVIVGDGYVYAQGDFPVLLVAHMDTVHRDLPKRIVYCGDNVSSPQGIGGDDRCGVYAILQLIKKHKCSVLFCEDEEIGCVGTGKFLKTELAKSLVGTFNYIIELDRKGSKDAVFYDCDNPDFEDFITREFYDTSFGSMSDISFLAPYLECAAVNLSCGYYNQHTKAEYIVPSELDRAIIECDKLLQRTDKSVKFEFIEACNDSWYNDYYLDEWRNLTSPETKTYYVYFIDRHHKCYGEDIDAISFEEAVGKFLIMYPNTCYDDIDVALL